MLAFVPTVRPHPGGQQRPMWTSQASVALRRKLQLQARAAAIPDAVVNRMAVSDRLGEMKLYLPEPGSGLASAHQRGDTSVVQQRYREVFVPATTLEAYMREAKLDRIDVLKIDVEGHEMAVLSGARRAIEHGRVGCVLFEFGSANVNSRTFFRDFWSYFTRNGYALKRIIPGGRVVDVARYDDTLEYFRGSSNYIAVRVASSEVRSGSIDQDAREPASRRTGCLSETVTVPEKVPVAADVFHERA